MKRASLSLIFDIFLEYMTSPAYDLVILGSGHRDGWASKLHFWDQICKFYSPIEVAYIEGADYHLPVKVVKKYSKCAGHLFSREGPVPRSVRT
jgi:hypothetical protein